MPKRLGLILAAAVLTALIGGPATAQAPATAPKQEPTSRAQRQAGQTPNPEQAEQTLPPEQTTEHTLDVGGRQFRFTASVGALRINHPGGREAGDIVYVAYKLAGAETRTRPVTFVFNGGPGSASTWLHIGAVGPWRLPLDPDRAFPSAPPELQPNAETWLDLTDLVFIDPVGTGYSRIVQPQAGGEGGGGGDRSGANRYFYSVNGDAESVAQAIEAWLRKNDRLASPKLILGESYAGIRAPKVLTELQTKQGIGMAALVLISPVLDFDGRSGSSPLLYAQLLPSLAASHMEHEGKTPSREALADAETYARGDYLTDVLKGPRNADALGRIVPRVASLTGLKPDTVRQLAGRVGGNAYIREVYRPEGRIASSYDSSVTGFDPNPNAVITRFEDPFSTALMAPMTSAMISLYDKQLNWHTDRRYYMLSMEANRSWQWGNSTTPPEAVSDLKAALALDPRLQVLVVHGFTDLVTPYLGSVMALDQLPAYGDATRVGLKVYPGGHMVYARDASRAALHEDARRLIGRIATPARD